MSIPSKRSDILISIINSESYENIINITDNPSTKGFIYETGDVPRAGSRYFFDASAGFVGYSKNFFFGGAVHHLNKPNESMIEGTSKLPMRFTGHMGAEIKLGKGSKYTNTTSIMPNIIYQYQNGFQELSLGTYVKYGVFTFGAWYRNTGN